MKENANAAVMETFGHQAAKASWLAAQCEKDKTEDKVRTENGWINLGFDTSKQANKYSVPFNANIRTAGGVQIQAAQLRHRLVDF